MPRKLGESSTQKRGKSGLYGASIRWTRGVRYFHVQTSFYINKTTRKHLNCGDFRSKQCAAYMADKMTRWFIGTDSQRFNGVDHLPGLVSMEQLYELFGYKYCLDLIRVLYHSERIPVQYQSYLKENPNA